MKQRDREHDEYSTPGGINKETGIPLAYDEEDASEDIADTIEDTKQEVKTNGPSQMVLFSLFLDKKMLDLTKKRLRAENAIVDLIEKGQISDEGALSMREQVVACHDPYCDTIISRENKSGIVISIEVKGENK